MVDDILFSKYILNQLSPEKMAEVERILINDNESEAIILANIAYSQENMDLIREFLDEDEINIEIDRNLANSSARNQRNIGSTNVKQNQITMKTTLSEHDKMIIADLVQAFHENEDVNQTIDARLISFYQAYCLQVSNEEAMEVVNSMRKGIKLFSDNLSQAFNDGVGTLSSKLDTIGEELPIEDRYNLFLNILALLNTIDNSNFDEDELSDNRTFDSFRDLLRVQGVISESDVDELKEEILHTLSESSFSVMTTVSVDDILKATGKVTELSKLTREDTMHEILVTSVAMNVAIQTGRLETEFDNIVPESIAVGVAAGFEEMKVVSKLENGEIDDGAAWEIIKIISAVVGVTLLMIAASTVIALTSTATFIGFLELFGSFWVASIVGAIVTMWVGSLIVSSFHNMVKLVEESGGELLDKLVDNLRTIVVPNIKKRIEFFMERIDDLVHSGVILVKSLLSRVRGRQK